VSALQSDNIELIFIKFSLIVALLFIRPLPTTATSIPQLLTKAAL